MQHLFWALSGLLFSATLAMAQVPAGLPDNAAVAQILADRIDRDGQGVGMAIALVDGSAAPRFVMHGPLDAGGAPVTEHTLFEIGSITKIFTDLLLADMVVRGEMKLDDPVVAYLPAGTVIPERDGKQITLFDLATHTSGLPRLPANMAPADPLNPYADYATDQFYAFLAAYALPRDIGVQFEYSNLGLALLGQAIVTKAGQDYETLLRTRILEPLGMSETAITLTPELTARFAVGHDAQLAATSHWDLGVFAPAGALRSTAFDLSKFVAAASGAVSTPLDAAFALMLERTRPVVPATEIALGWLMTTSKDTTIVWHDGATGGFNSFLGVNRATKSGVVALSNTASASDINDIGLHLMDQDRPLAPQPKRRVAVEIDPALLQNYVGNYALEPQLILAVTVENGHLFVEATGESKLEVFPEGEHNFFFKAADAQLTFNIGADGKASSLVLHQGGQDMPGARQ